MEPLPSSVENESPSGSRFRWWVPIRVIFVLIVIFFGVVAVVWMTRKQVPSVTQNSPEQELLGAWREVSSSYYDDTSSSSPQTTDYATSSGATLLGFVTKDGLNIMRTYDSPGNASALSQLMLWKTATSSTNALSIGVFAYGTTTDDTLPDKENISFITPDKIVIHSHDFGSSYLEQTFVRARSASEEAAMDFTRTAVENQALCDGLLNGSSTEQTNMLLPISCTASIGPGADAVTFDFAVDGSLTVTNGGKTILALHTGDPFADDASDTVDFILDGGSSGPFLNNFGVFSLHDVTFDGYKDIEALESAGAYNFTYSYYAFNPKTGVFDPTPIVTAVNGGFDPAARTITSFDKGRGIGDIYESDTYHFQNGRYVLVERDIQDVRDQTNYDTSLGYVYTVEKLINGKMSLVKKSYLTEAQVLGNDSGIQVSGN